MVSADRDKAKLDALLKGELDPADFNHRDHIVVAYCALKHYEFFHAAHLLADGLRNLATGAGVPEKFNATVTLAAISVIAERMEKGTYGSSEEFICENPDIVSPGFLTAQYPVDRLNGELSRKIGLLPQGSGPIN